MLHLLLAAALIAQAAPQEEADKAAAELLKKLEAKVMNAKSLHLQFEAKTSGEGREDIFKGELKFGEGGGFWYKATMISGGGTREEEIILKSDGRSTIGVVSRPRGGDFTKWKPDATLKCLKRAAVEAAFLGTYLVMGRHDGPEAAFEEFTPGNVKSAGKEKVGEVEATIVSFALALKEGPPDGLTLKLWVDPARLIILKRSMAFGRQSLDETMSKFEINPAFPADHFEFQNAAMLLEGRAIQLAASVALHARYTGRLPKTLDDLAKRPADLPAAVFWPEGGFWIGGAIPKDIAYSFDATHFTVGPVREAIPAASAIGAPTERLKKYFQAQVRMQLIKAAARGFLKSSSLAVKDAQDLLKKPEAVRFWPEGGWIGGSVPVDPWGDPLVIRPGDPLHVSVANPKGRILRFAELTPEERKALDATAMPALTEKDTAEVAALLKRLGAEKLADREAATQAIIAKGGGALKLVEERLAGEKDPEIEARLGVIRDHFRSMKPTWISEFRGRRFTLVGTGGDPANIPANERNASTCLKTITTAQADFRSNDRDGNRTMDFYTRDVAGLYALKPAIGAALEATAGKEGESHAINRLIEPSLAKADTTEDRWEYPVLEIKEPEPKSGYFFAALKQCEIGGKVEAYHAGSGRNLDMFGYIAYPAEYGVTGKLTLIVNEDNTIWMKDVGVEDIDTFPAAPAAAGWRKMD